MGALRSRATPVATKPWMCTPRSWMLFVARLTPRREVKVCPTPIHSLANGGGDEKRPRAPRPPATAEAAALRQRPRPSAPTTEAVALRRRGRLAQAWTGWPARPEAALASGERAAPPRTEGTGRLNDRHLSQSAPRRWCPSQAERKTPRATSRWTVMPSTPHQRRLRAACMP